jgi:hypothetical protein
MNKFSRYPVVIISNSIVSLLWSRGNMQIKIYVSVNMFLGHPIINSAVFLIYLKMKARICFPLFTLQFTV